MMNKNQDRDSNKKDLMFKINKLRIKVWGVSLIVIWKNLLKVFLGLKLLNNLYKNKKIKWKSRPEEKVLLIQWVEPNSMHQP